MTILREAEHQALKHLTLSGKVLDLGGEKRSEYTKFIQGTFTTTTVNLAGKDAPDIVADLEKPLPVGNREYDAVLLMNVLEHIFEYRALLNESARVLKPGGTIAILVPYMFPYHASPHDFHRYSAEALRRALSASGFSNIETKALGTGVFAVQQVMIERLIPGSLQKVIAVVTHPLVRITDWLFTLLARLLNKKYDPADYALGFFVTAIKHG